MGASQFSLCIIWSSVGFVGRLLPFTSLLQCRSSVGMELPRRSQFFCPISSSIFLPGG